MHTKKAVAVLGLGTNIGSKNQNIKTAIRFLEIANIKIVKQAKLYQTPPWGFNAKEDFFNTVVCVETELNPIQLLIEIKAIELKMGRPSKVSAMYESRIIDIDIIDFENKVYQYHDLIIPHPYMHKRNFVLLPLRDVKPNYRHPILNKNIEQLIGELDDETIAVVNMSAL